MNVELTVTQYAYHHGFAVRYSTQLETAVKDANGEWLCTVKDHVREDTYISRKRHTLLVKGHES